MANHDVVVAGGNVGEGLITNGSVVGAGNYIIPHGIFAYGSVVGAGGEVVEVVPAHGIVVGAGGEGEEGIMAYGVVVAVASGNTKAHWLIPQGYII